MKIAIIGGGMAGLGAAYELTKKTKVEIRVFERSSELGGLAHSVTIGGTPLEAYYHHMFPTYYDFFEIADEIGIKRDIFFTKAPTGIFYKGKTYPMSAPLDLLRFSPLSPLERIRMGFILAWLKIKRNYKNFEKVTAETWLKKYMGEHAYGVMWEPLLVSKFGDKASTVSMAWFWSRVYERPNKFGYFKGGFKTLIDALERFLRKKNVQISLSSPVQKITKRDEQYIVHTEGKEETFDCVIIAAPPVSFIKMAEDLLPQPFIERTRKLDYQGTLCGILVLKQHLTDYYWLNINEKDYPFVGVIDHAHFVSPETYGGRYPVYIARYLNASHPLYKASDDDLWSQFLPLLKKINPAFDESWITERYMFRAPFTQPVVPINYKSIRPSYATPVKGLWWVSMSHIYPWDRGTDHSFHAGRELARELLTDADSQ